MRKTKVLIVAPHPDDEVIGCLPIIYDDDTLEVHVVLVTQGDREGRVSEFIACAEIFRFTFSILCEKDGSVGPYKGTVDYIRSLCVDLGVSTLYVPWEHDEHPDHKQLGRCIPDLNTANYSVYAYSNIVDIPEDTPHVDIINPFSEEEFKALMQVVYRTEYKRLLKDNYPKLYKPIYRYAILHSN